MRCERSPLATAPMTRATSSVGWTRSPMSVLIDSIRSAQAPVAAPTIGPLRDPALLADDRGDPGGLPGVVLEQVGEVVERLGDRGPDDGVLDGQADAEIALLEGLQRRQQSFGVELSVRRGCRGPGRYRPRRCTIPGVRRLSLCHRESPRRSYDGWIKIGGQLMRPLTGRVKLCQLTCDPGVQTSFLARIRIA